MRLPIVGSILVVLAAGMMSCGDEHLRGRTTPSPDNGTYLSFDLEELPQCNPLIVDDREWPPPYDEARSIEPGQHLVRCGEDDTGIGFTVPAGVVFVFDYWGP
jgi:hypothetical protein